MAFICKLPNSQKIASATLTCCASLLPLLHVPSLFSFPSLLSLLSPNLPQLGCLSCPRCLLLILTLPCISSTLCFTTQSEYFLATFLILRFWHSFMISSLSDLASTLSLMIRNFSYWHLLVYWICLRKGWRGMGRIRRQEVRSRRLVWCGRRRSRWNREGFVVWNWDSRVLYGDQGAGEDSMGCSISIVSINNMLARILRRLRCGYSDAKGRLYVFGGQGLQEKGMLNSLLPQYQPQIDAYQSLLNLNLLELTSPTCPPTLLNQTQNSQPLIVLSQYLHFLKHHLPISSNDILVGHSVGQYTALVLSNSLTIEQALKTVRLRGQLMTKCTTKPSGMLVVIAKKEDIKVIGELVEKGGMEVACYNTQSQLVIAGTMEKAKDLYAEMKKKKIISTFLPVSAAFHCKELKAMVPEFESHLKTLNIQPPKVTIYRNIDAKPYKTKEDIVEGLTKQLYCPVMFEKAIRLVPKSVEFQEIGHKPIVTRFIKQIRASME